MTDEALIERIARAMGRAPAQRDMLIRAVKTNGGGLNAYSENKSVWSSLYKKGLVQGKKGSPSSIVHTAMGLSVFRAMEKHQ